MSDWNVGRFALGKRAGLMAAARAARKEARAWRARGDEATMLSDELTEAIGAERACVAIARWCEAVVRRLGP